MKWLHSQCEELAKKRISEIEDLKKENDLLIKTIKLKEHDIIKATREVLKGITVDLSYLDAMSREETNGFLAKASNILNDSTFQKITDYLINKQMKFTVEEAENWEQAKFGRATIFGITLLRDELQALDAMYKDLNKKEVFDEHSIL